jgi:hypothetical protein
VVRVHNRTIKRECQSPDSPVICGTLMNNKTPRIFYKTGKKTPNKTPYLYTPINFSSLLLASSSCFLETSP